MKTVHWQLPFSSVKGTEYRIDIYDTDYTGNAVLLTGGSSPFVTEEDNSDDYFSSVRGQTGSIEIVNTSGELSIYDMLPQTNTERPVRLIDVARGVCVWQGFLSCEAYSQGYNARPQNISLPVKSVLSAMDSAEYKDDKPSVQQVKVVLSNILKSCEEEGAVISSVYVPFRSVRFLSKYIDTTVLYDMTEVSNENSTTYMVKPKSSKTALERICTYMGWTAREEGMDLYLIDATNDKYCKINRSNLETYNTLTPTAGHTIMERRMSSLNYEGAGHSISISQGAKRVEVLASLEKYKVNAGIPDQSPVDEGSVQYIDTCTTYHSDDISFDNRCTFVNQYIGVDTSDPSHPYIRTVVQSSVSETFNYAAIKRDYIPETNTSTAKSYHAGTFMAMIEDSDSSRPLDRTSGMYISTMKYGAAQLCGFVPTESNYIFRFDSMMRLAASSGKLKISINGYTLARQDGQVLPRVIISKRASVMCALRCGNVYYDADMERWRQEASYFPLSTESEEVFEAAVSTSGMNGTIELLVYPVSGNTSTDFEKEEMLLTDLSVKYEEAEGLNERDENHYSVYTGHPYSDEVVIETSLASDMNNGSSPSVVRESATTMMRMLDYLNADYTVEKEKPERVLLSRLSEYYSRSRIKLTIEVAHISVSLPLLRLIGFDGKKYIPLSEKRDWLMGLSTIKCFEKSE